MELANLLFIRCSYSEGSPEEEFGDSSVIHMLTGWTMYAIPFSPSAATADVWDILGKILPLWVRPPDTASDETVLEEGISAHAVTSTHTITPAKSKYMVLGSFGSCFPCLTDRPLSTAALQKVVRKRYTVAPLIMVGPERLSSPIIRLVHFSEALYFRNLYLLQENTETLLKRFSVIPSDYSLNSQPSFPVLLTQVRDQPVHPPPKEPPLPQLQTPYYLGLKFRLRQPGLPTPPPTPPPVDPRFVELLPTIADYDVSAISAIPMQMSSNSAVASQYSIKMSQHTPSDIRISEKPSKVATSSRSKLGVSISVLKPSSDRTLRIKEPEPEPVPEYSLARKWMDYCEFVSAFE